MNEIQGRFQDRRILYWRDKRHHEVDFIWKRKGKDTIAIECKWSADQFEPSGMQAFRRLYPKGKNYVVAHDIRRSFSRAYKDLTVEFLNLAQLIEKIV